MNDRVLFFILSALSGYVLSCSALVGQEMRESDTDLSIGTEGDADSDADTVSDADSDTDTDPDTGSSSDSDIVDHCPTKSTRCLCTLDEPPLECETHPDFDGVGICTAGERHCTLSESGDASDWGECIGSVGPGVEVCDPENLDEDCNGVPNDGCFVSGPCIVNPDPSHHGVELFVRGNNQSIYRRTIYGNPSSGWMKTNLDGSVLHSGTDLECAAINGMSHVIVRGNNPNGAALMAIGSGNTFDNFERIYTDTVFTAPPSIASHYGGQSGYSMGELHSGNLTVSFVSSSTSEYTVGEEAINSAIDHVFVEPTSMGNYSLFAGFNTNANELVVRTWAMGYSGNGWSTVVIPPPPGTTYEYSPTLCAMTPEQTGEYNEDGVHAVVVADGALWYADLGTYPTTSGTYTWSPLLPSVAAASAPDCVKTKIIGTSSIILNVVLINTDGETILIDGNTTDGFVETNLGRY